MSFDQWVLDSAVSQRTAWLVDVVDVITDSGGTLASWLIATLLTIVLLVRRLRTEALLIAGSMLTGLLVMSGLKRIFTRTRPTRSGEIDRNRFVFVPVGPRDDERDTRDFGCRRDSSACLAEAREDGNAREPRPVHDRCRILPRLPGCPLDDRCAGRLGVRDGVGRSVDLGNCADQEAPGAGYFVSSASSWLVAHGKLSAELAVRAAPTCGA